MAERKLVRARIKALEYLPEHARCCQRQIDALLALPEMIVDLSRTQIAVTYCRWCDAERPEDIGVMDIADGKYVYITELDLDEGAEANGN